MASGVLRSVIVVVAQWLPPLVVVAAAVVGLLLPRERQVRVVVQAVVALFVAVAAVKVAGAVHVDPRPFVVDPAVRPLFPHPADNGFPSDHTTFAVAAAVSLFGARRRVAGTLAAAGVLGGLARVAAHVHHVQDIAAGAALGVLAALIGAAVAARLVTWSPLRRVDKRWSARPVGTAAGHHPGHEIG